MIYIERERVVWFRATHKFEREGREIEQYRGGKEETVEKLEGTKSLMACSVTLLCELHGPLP